MDIETTNPWVHELCAAALAARRDEPTKNNEQALGFKIGVALNVFQAGYTVVSLLGMPRGVTVDTGSLLCVCAITLMLTLGIGSTVSFVEYENAKLNGDLVSERLSICGMLMGLTTIPVALLGIFIMALCRGFSFG